MPRRRVPGLAGTAAIEGLGDIPGHRHDTVATSGTDVQAIPGLGWLGMGLNSLADEIPSSESVQSGLFDFLGTAPVKPNNQDERFLVAAIRAAAGGLPEGLPGVLLGASTGLGKQEAAEYLPNSPYRPWIDFGLDLLPPSISFAEAFGGLPLEIAREVAPGLAEAIIDNGKALMDSIDRGGGTNGMPRAHPVPAGKGMGLAASPAPSVQAPAPPPMPGAPETVGAPPDPQGITAARRHAYDRATTPLPPRRPVGPISSTGPCRLPCSTIRLHRMPARSRRRPRK